VTHVRYTFDAYWFVALACAAIAFFIFIQYLIKFISEIYKLHFAGGKRAIERMRNLKRGEPPEAEPAVSRDLPLQASAEVQPILEHARPPEPEPAVSRDLPLQASAEVQPILEHARPPEAEPAVSRDLPLQASAEVQPILEHARPPEPEPAVSRDLPLQASAEVQPILEHAKPPEPEPAYAANRDYDRAPSYNEAIRLDPKFAVSYKNRNVTKCKMGDKAGANADLATAKHVKLGRLGDTSEKKEAALTPKEESTPEGKSAAKDVRAFKGSIGVTIRRVTDGDAHALNVKPADGALVVDIDENGPAKAAGIEPDDVIVKVDGKDVKECRDLPRIVADMPAGKEVAVTIMHKGKELTKMVKVGRLEDADKQESFTSQMGSAPQEKPVAVDSKAVATLAPPRFGKRQTDHFSKVSH
jgi:PDZ domain